MSDESKDKCFFNDNIKGEDIAMVVRRFKKVIGKKKSRYNKKFPKKE